MQNSIDVCRGGVGSVDSSVDFVDGLVLLVQSLASNLAFLLQDG